jgi:hypothetical protein
MKSHLAVVTGGCVAFVVTSGALVVFVAAFVVFGAAVVAGLHAGFEGFLAQHFGSFEFGAHSSSGGR